MINVTFYKFIENKNKGDGLLIDFREVYQSNIV